MASLIVRPRARVFHGHDWVHDNEVLKVTGQPTDGDGIGLKDQRDRFLGSAIYHSRSKIPARRFSRQRQDLDADFFLRRLRMASEYRDRLGLDPTARREVWSESDGLPGLILDRYGDCAVVQTLTLAMDLRKDLIADAIMEVMSPRCLIERNDAQVRKAEGLELHTGILRGEAPGPFEVALGGVRFGIELPGDKNRPLPRPSRQLRPRGRPRQGTSRARLLQQPRWFALAVQAPEPPGSLPSTSPPTPAPPSAPMRSATAPRSRSRRAMSSIGSRAPSVAATATTLSSSTHPPSPATARGSTTPCADTRKSTSAPPPSSNPAGLGHLLLFPPRFRPDLPRHHPGCHDRRKAHRAPPHPLFPASRPPRRPRTPESAYLKGFLLEMAPGR